MKNPYAAPNASGHEAPLDLENVNVVISGQKQLIYSIIGYLCSAAIMVFANVFLEGTPEKPEVTTMFGVVLGFGLLCVFTAAVFASIGIFRMGRVLFPGSTRYIYAIGVLIPAPLIGLIVMIVANASASGYLKARGYKIGFWGAKPL